MLEVRSIRVRGRVQGVGFRPFVWKLANELELVGDVRNDGEGVLIRAAGCRISELVAKLLDAPPPLSVVEDVEVNCIEFQLPSDFQIVDSGPNGADTSAAPDAAMCTDCREEIESSGRRFAYPFTNCTNCGPRFAILRALPYDRAHTTMNTFEMCAQCRAEYEDPTDRRFHAQPIACSDCGPKLWGEPRSEDPILGAAIQILNGGILAIKGLGGFHLACDATNAEAIRKLRTRKCRPSKPFALMASLERIGGYALLSDANVDLLSAPDAPVVLIKSAGELLPDAVAPGMDRFGWMLPYTPLHHLLIEKVGRPLVMTSGNVSSEPQVIGNEEARDKLGHIADAFLMHDRDIARRLDDSVVVQGLDVPMVIRRARGLTPGTIALPQSISDDQILACGGEFKSSLCLTKNGQAMLSHHLGDLDNPAAYEEFLKANIDLAELMEHQPNGVVVDLHAGFRATEFGKEKAWREGVRLIEVQHHHAHMAAALGSIGWNGDVAVGLILDGLGLGVDGTIWGGEVLVGEYSGFRRVSHLSYASLPGGDRAQREPWRNALIRLDAAGLSAQADQIFTDLPVDQMRLVAESGINSPPCSSAGRLFDAIAACLGIVPKFQTFEGEAAMRLEALARSAPKGGGAYNMDNCDGFIDPSPLFRSIVNELEKGIAVEIIARRAHEAIAVAFSRAAHNAASDAGADTIALSGGCFQNVLLLEMVSEKLTDFCLCGPGQVPVNDGGLAFGQALIGLAQSA